MNRMIGSRNGGGLIEAAKGAALGGDRLERLNAAQVRYEAAVHEGRTIDAEMADAQIEALLAEGRAAREAQTSNVGQGEQQQMSGSGFDGGVRGQAIRNGRPVPRRRPRSGMRSEGAGQLFTRAMVQSNIEQGEARRVPWANDTRLS